MHLLQRHKINKYWNTLQTHRNIILHSSLFIKTLEIDTLVGLGMPQMAKSPGFSIQLYILNMKMDQGVPEAMHNLSTHPEHT